MLVSILEIGMPQPCVTCDTRAILVLRQVCDVLRIPHHNLNPAMKILIKEKFEIWLKETSNETTSQIKLLDLDKKAKEFANDEKACEFLNPSLSLKSELWDQ